MPILWKSRKRINKHQSGGAVSVYPSYQVKMAATPQADPSALLKRYAQPAAKKTTTASGGAKKAKSDFPEIGPALDSDAAAFLYGYNEREEALSNYLFAHNGNINATPEGPALKRSLDEYSAGSQVKLKNNKDTFDKSYEATLGKAGNDGGKSWMFDGTQGYVYDKLEKNYRFISPELLNTEKLDNEEYRFIKVNYEEAFNLRENTYDTPSLFFNWDFTQKLGNGMSIDKVFTNTIDNVFEGMEFDDNKKTVTLGNYKDPISKADIKKYLEGDRTSNNSLQLTYAFNNIKSRLQGGNSGAALVGWAWSNSTTPEEVEQRIDLLLANELGKRMKIVTDVTTENILNDPLTDVNGNPASNQSLTGKTEKGELTFIFDQTKENARPLSFEIRDGRDGAEYTSIMTTSEYSAVDASQHINPDIPLNEQLAEYQGKKGFGSFAKLKETQGLNGEQMADVSVYTSNSGWKPLLEVAMIDETSLTYVRLPIDPETNAVLEGTDKGMEILEQALLQIQIEAKADPVRNSIMESSDPAEWKDKPGYQKYEDRSKKEIEDYLAGVNSYKGIKQYKYKSFYKANIDYVHQYQDTGSNVSPYSPKVGKNGEGESSVWLRDYSNVSNNGQDYLKYFGDEPEDKTGQNAVWRSEVFNDTWTDNRAAQEVHTTTVLIPAGNMREHQSASARGKIMTNSENLSAHKLTQFPANLVSSLDADEIRTIVGNIYDYQNQ
jgi:hypothetical protein